MGKHLAGRTCAICGQPHGSPTSPICHRCRRKGSKKPCPIPGCDKLINACSSTCLNHRHLQKKESFELCRECGNELPAPTRLGLCPECHKGTYVLCACGCGKYRRKYDSNGLVREYISGHADAWVEARRPLIVCPVCGKEFKSKGTHQRLCGIECRTKWINIKHLYENKKVLVECTACGKQIYRIPSTMSEGAAYACSKQCQSIIVRNKLRGPRSDKKRLALQRDHAKCVICGFDILVEVHHIVARHKNGLDELENMITLCPNHHTMADRGLISAESLRECVQHGQRLDRPDRESDDRHRKSETTSQELPESF